MESASIISSHSTSHLVVPRIIIALSTIALSTMSIVKAKLSKLSLYNIDMLSEFFFVHTLKGLWLWKINTVINVRIKLNLGSSERGFAINR